jgi:hypothetical protein
VFLGKSLTAPGADAGEEEVPSWAL